MNKTNSLKPFSYSYEKNNLESNTRFRKNNPVTGPDKIYFFRTSLFWRRTESASGFSGTTALGKAH